MDNRKKLTKMFGILWPRNQVMKSAELFLKTIGVSSGLTDEQKERFTKLSDELHKAQTDEFVKSVDGRFTDNEIDYLSEFYNSVVSAKWSAFHVMFLPKLMNFKFEGGMEAQEKINKFFQSVIDENGPLDSMEDFFY